MIDADQEAIVFMKVGRHAGETFEQILERKRREYERAGAIFWGYGGGTMHPITKVQPFVQSVIQRGKDIRLLMQSMDSRHPDTEVVATEFSRDGVIWEPVPAGIEVRGSRYALVLDEIESGELELDLDAYAVGIGPSAGKNAAGYIRGRVDKGLLERTAEAPARAEDSKIVKVNYAAKLKEPFAVLLR